MKRIAAALALSFVIGCAGPESGPPVEFLDGFDPPPPALGEIQVISPIVRDIPAGADVTLCSFLEFQTDDDLDVLGFDAFQSAGGHHAILYSVKNHKPVDTHPCTEDDMVNARFVSATAGEGTNIDLPEGLAFRLPLKTQLMIQTHWVNGRDTAIDGQAAFNVRVQPPSDAVMVADLFSAASTRVSIPARSEGSAHTTCPIAEELTFWSIAGHAHEWGRSVKLSLTPAEGSTQVLWDAPEWAPEMVFRPNLTTFPLDAPLALHPGDTLSIDCTYFNDTDDDIRFPQEMCVGFGFYFPADRELDCTDGAWPTE